MPDQGYPLTIGGETTDVSTAAELVVALDVLEGQHDREALEQLGGHLADVLGAPPGLHSVMAALQPTEQLLLVEVLGERLAEAVGTARALRDLLATLADPRIEAALLAGLGGEGLRQLIGTPEELAGVLEWVYGSCDAEVLELLGPEFLADLFQTGGELGLVLRALDPRRQEELIAQLGWERVAGLARDERDLGHLVRALPSELSRRLLECYSGATLAGLVHSERAWQQLQRFLDADELAYLTARREASDHAE